MPSISTTVTTAEVDYPVCDSDAPLPSASDDWYRDRPVYVANEAPYEEVRQFASALPGFVEVWFDRDRFGWLSVGFVGVDIEEMQTLLQAEFPDVGVVAVELEYTLSDLRALATDVGGRLPDGMDTENIDRLRGLVHVWVGLLTPENIEMGIGAAADSPFCIDGFDVEYYDQSPQVDGGDGWSLVGAAEGSASGDAGVPVVVTDQTALAALWGQLGLSAEAPSVDFTASVVAAFPVHYPANCPDQRLDGLTRTSLIVPNVRNVSLVKGCWLTGNPRTFIVEVERSSLGPPPTIWLSEANDSWGLEVTDDLRVRGASLSPDGSSVDNVERREASPMPNTVRVGVPKPLIVPVACDLTYLGVVNWVGWYLPEGAEVPPGWSDSAVDGLIDLEMSLFEWPDAKLVVSAGGDEVTFFPGERLTPGCQP